jgi:hypothetical protein
MREPCNRSAEVKVAAGKLVVYQNDFCDECKQDSDRLFYGKECWYCKYGDFGIFTDHPTESGVCKYMETNI